MQLKTNYTVITKINCGKSRINSKRTSL